MLKEFITLKIDFVKNSVSRLFLLISFFYFLSCHAAFSVEKQFDELVLDLNSSFPEIRVDAAWALGELGDQRAVEHLVKALRDPDECTRYCVVKALKNLGDKRAIPELEKALTQEIKPWIVQAIKEAIEELK